MKKRTRKAKAVKAWAVVDVDGNIHFCGTDGEPEIYRTREEASVFVTTAQGERIARVVIKEI